MHCMYVYTLYVRVPTLSVYAVYILYVCVYVYILYALYMYAHTVAHAV